MKKQKWKRRGGEKTGMQTGGGELRVRNSKEAEKSRMTEKRQVCRREIKKSCKEQRERNDKEEESESDE